MLAKSNLGSRIPISSSSVLSTPRTGQNKGTRLARTTAARKNLPAATSSSPRNESIGSLGNQQHKTSFSTIYNRGGIPCRVAHGSVKHKLSWIGTAGPPSGSWDPLLVLFFEGLREVSFPYTFLVREGIAEMLSVPGAEYRMLPILPALTKSLRAALSSPEKSIFDASVGVLIQLAHVMGPALVPSLPLLIPPLAPKALSTHTPTRERVFEALSGIECSCGADGLRLIKVKIPTYASVQQF